MKATEIKKTQTKYKTIIYDLMEIKTNFINYKCLVMSDEN